MCQTIYAVNQFLTNLKTYFNDMIFIRSIQMKKYISKSEILLISKKIKYFIFYKLSKNLVNMFLRRCFYYENYDFYSKMNFEYSLIV